MLRPLKQIIKRRLRYEPLAETVAVRDMIERNRQQNLPYCPPYEGDLLYLLIQRNGFRRCLETGFHTGSTALYMAAAVADRKGSVTSVSIDEGDSLARGLKLVHESGYGETHRMITKNSNRALPELFLEGDTFDVIYMDGWKTFDHLAMEMYYCNQMLNTGGVIIFDDSNMPSVRRAITLLKKYYGYEEIDYATFNETPQLRLFQIVTTRSLKRCYRALIKKTPTENQPPFNDWHFDSLLT